MFRFPLPPLLVAVLPLVVSAGPTTLPVAAQSFDADPHWDGANNRPPAGAGRSVKQDFGPTDTGVGGTIFRSSVLAYCAAKISPRSLEKSLSAEGDFAITHATSTTGCFFGFFNSAPGPGGRPFGSLGLYFDGEKNGARLHLRLVSPSNMEKGMRVDGGQKKDTPLAIDAKPHHWKLSYDPAGTGTVSFQLDNAPLQQIQLPDWAKADRITFDRFGLMNTRKSGNAFGVHFDHLRLDGQPLKVSPDQWDQSGNHAEFTDTHLAGNQDFGFSPTHFAGGAKPGELGGTFWRSAKAWSYCATPVGPLDSSQSLEASGTVTMTVGAPDSAMDIGFFSPAHLTGDHLNNFVGVHVEGPSRVGHYFAPEFAGPTGKPRRAQQAPLLVPDGKSHRWRLSLQSNNDGTRVLHVELDEKSADLAVPPNVTASVDHFGVLPGHVGGNEVRIYFDDLTYTTARKRSP